jgi:hypothetical protein
MRIPLSLKALALTALLILVPFVGVTIAEKLFQRPALRLETGWEDSVFNANYQNPIWVDNFVNGWQVNRALGQSGNSSGFTVERGVGTLFATFSGFNKEYETGVSGIEVQKPLDQLNTELAPYLIIEHRESSSDSSLKFSCGITDEYGTRYDAGWWHTSTSWITSEVDLRSIYNGTIKYLSIGLTDDLNPSYSGGIQSAQVRLIGIYSAPPQWTLATSDPEAMGSMGISSANGTLWVQSNYSLNQNTIVTAERTYNLTIDVTKHRYLSVSIMTSSINVAARVVIWTNATNPVEVLLKTYNDGLWHTEIVDLGAFGIRSNDLFEIELGFIQLKEGSGLPVFASYRSLSFSTLVG